MSQNSSANRKNHHANNSAEKFANMDNLLILEKALEQSGQDWIENLNIIEQLLVRVTDRLSQENPSLRSKFIIRRLPTYLVRFKFSLKLSSTKIKNTYVHIMQICIIILVHMSRLVRLHSPTRTSMLL